MAFTFTKDVDGPFYLYYEMKNFFQNHRRYYLSYDASQLQGQLLSEGDVSLNCDPLYKNGSLLLNPCGLVASSFFNGKSDRPRPCLVPWSTPDDSNPGRSRCGCL